MEGGIDGGDRWRGIAGLGWIGVDIVFLSWCLCRAWLAAEQRAELASAPAAAAAARASQAKEGRPKEPDNQRASLTGWSTR